MEHITIVVAPLSMTVVDGREAGAKLWYQAPGLDVFVSGDVCACKEHKVRELALDSALARHIPAIALRDVRERRAPRKPKIAREQGRLL